MASWNSAFRGRCGDPTRWETPCRARTVSGRKRPPMGPFQNEWLLHLRADGVSGDSGGHDVDLVPDPLWERVEPLLP